MNRKRFYIIFLLGLLVVLAVSLTRYKLKTSSAKSAQVAASSPPESTGTNVASVQTPEPVNASVASSAPKPEVVAGTSREQSVQAWEGLIDSMRYQGAGAPSAQRAKQVKAAFDRLEKQDQMESIQRGLNLLPDEQFGQLNDILFDKNEAKEVLDAIFSDALNRTDEIKLPIMQELRKDREHPMYFESARILDVIEPTRVTPQK